MAPDQGKKPDRAASADAATPKASQPKERSDEELRTLLEELQKLWPVDRKEHRERIRREVLKPYRDYHISREEATKRWKSMPKAPPQQAPSGESTSAKDEGTERTGGGGHAEDEGVHPAEAPVAPSEAETVKLPTGAEAEAARSAKEGAAPQAPSPPVAADPTTEAVPPERSARQAQAKESPAKTEARASSSTAESGSAVAGTEAAAPGEAGTPVTTPSAAEPVKEGEQAEPAPAPIANFSAAPTDGETPFTVQFADRSQGDITSWAWEFGDGATSAERTPTHEYGLAGSYSVKLTVTGPTGSSTVKRDGWITATTPPPEWKVLEPEDRSDPVPHELCTLKARDDQRNIMAASVRGKLHAHRATWRDDAFAFDWVADWTITAVSDGAGSARLSRISARAACDESVQTLKELLTGYELSVGEQDSPGEADLRRLRTFLVEGARKAQTAILREAQKRKCAPKEMHATLLLMIHTPWKQQELVGAIQIGDGAVGIYTNDDTCTLMGSADHGEFGGETRFLTTPHIEHEFNARVLFSVKKGIRCIATMCDGVSDDFFPEEKRLIELFRGNPIKELKTKDGGPVMGVMHEVVKDPREGQALVEWLRYERRGSSDDRTLVLMYRND